MRFLVRAALVLLLFFVSGCGGLLFGDAYSYYVTGADGGQLNPEAEVGQAVPVRTMLELSNGCDNPESTYVHEGLSWKVEPSEGAEVKDGVFVAAEPGTYKITPVVAGAPDHATFGSFTFTVTASGEVVVETTTSEPPEPESTTTTTEVHPLVGTWEFTFWTRGQKQTPDQGVIVEEYEWFPLTSPIQITIAQAGDSFELVEGYLVSARLDVAGANVRIAGGGNGFEYVLEGAVSGDTITGTQSYNDVNAGAFSTEWVATRLK
jgi:hypothetical protein